MSYVKHSLFIASLNPFNVLCDGCLSNSYIFPTHFTEERTYTANNRMTMNPGLAKTILIYTCCPGIMIDDTSLQLFKVHWFG